MENCGSQKSNNGKTEPVSGHSRAGKGGHTPTGSMTCVLDCEVVWPWTREQRELSCCLLAVLEQILSLGPFFFNLSHEEDDTNLIPQVPWDQLHLGPFKCTEILSLLHEGYFLTQI